MSDPTNVSRFPGVAGELIPNPWMADPDWDPRRTPYPDVGARADMVKLRGFVNVYRRMAALGSRP